MKAWLQKIYDANLRDFGHLDNPHVMGLTLYAETADQPREGKIGVGTVIMERVDHRTWDGNTIQEVCLCPAQFTCYMFNRPDLKKYRDKMLVIARDFPAALRDKRNGKTLAECLEIATGMIDGSIPRNPVVAAAHCCQYLNPKIAAPGTKDAWLKAGMKLILTIKDHEYFA